MTVGTSEDFSIGALAEAAGVSVKTVRHYSDSGLLPASARSAGGHRRYGKAALEALLAIRRLRALGLALPAAGAVVRGDLPLADALASRQREVERQLTRLQWHSAALEALAAPARTPDPAALRLLGEALPHVPERDAFAAFWRRALPLRLPASLRSAIIDAALPEIPSTPTPRQALAYARLHALTVDRASAAAVRDQYTGVPDPVLLYQGLREAYELAAAELARSVAPRPGDALDCFIAAHARSKRKVDSADFRRTLATRLADTTHTGDTAMARYWDLAAELDPRPDPTMGAAHAWLAEALAAWGESS